MLEVAQYQIKGTTAREIALSAEVAIREGDLAPGARLPTVRALAGALGTSPATVNAAYRILRQRGLVVAEGRRGTRVAPRPALRTPLLDGWRGQDQGAASWPSNLRDLAIGLPDPELLPALTPALAKIDPDRYLRMSGLEQPDPKLRALAAADFAADGLPSTALAVVSGAFDGIERVLDAHLRPGDRVVVEDPAYSTTRDLLLSLGLEAVPVAVDEYGLIPELLEAALARGVDAAVIVPRAQNPLGAALDQRRAAELRILFAAWPEMLVIEDDHTASVSGAPFETSIDPARARWAVIRSTSKMIHPDLRLALMAGDETTIARVEGRQALGPRWVSHMLQATVAQVMGDDGFKATIARARDAYTDRRRMLIDALAELGIRAYGRSGLNVWVPVPEEGPVVRALFDAGWIVLAGERFRLATPPGIRVTVATLTEHEAHTVASVIARVEHSGRPTRLY